MKKERQGQRGTKDEERGTRDENQWVKEAKLNNQRFAWVIVSFVFLLMIAIGCGEKHSAKVDVYTCPMHPTILSDRAGTCPICGMDLVKKLHASETADTTEDLGNLTQSPSETIFSSIKTIKGQYKKIATTFDVQGMVTYDTRNIYTIPTKVGGRIEKNYIKYAFRKISKGEKIVEIYSPELITAQRELLFLLEKDAENKTSINAAKNRLALLGLTLPQLDVLVKQKKITNTFSLYSPYTGYVILGTQVPNTPSLPAARLGTKGMNNTMEEASSLTERGESPVENTLILREGTYVAAGQTLFTFVTTSALRIEIDLPIQEAKLLKNKSNLELDFGNGIKQKATVDFVQPFFAEGQYFTKIRVRTTEVKGLHIGHLVKVNLVIDPTESLWVPRESVLNLGDHAIVFTKERDGALHPKKVTTGITTNGLTEIKSGLASSQEIASNAQFLVDSESFIKTGK